MHDVHRDDHPAKFPKADPGEPDYSYRSQWWVLLDEFGGFAASGIHGQRLYVAPKAEMVIARFASHPVASGTAHGPITRRQMLA